MRNVFACVCLSLYSLISCKTTSKSSDPAPNSGATPQNPSGLPTRAQTLTLAGNLLGRSWNANFGLAYILKIAPDTMYLKFIDGKNGRTLNCDEQGRDYETENVPNPLSGAPYGEVTFQIPFKTGKISAIPSQDGRASYGTTGNYTISSPLDLNGEISDIQVKSVSGSVSIRDQKGTSLQGNFTLQLCREN